MNDFLDLRWAAIASMLVSLGSAFLLGSAIGLERQVRQRTAGLRTNTLVAVGSAIFVHIGNRLFELHGGGQSAVTVVAYVVSGIGFLGAGAIMKEGANVTGLNTAATLWGSGAVGACCGAGLVVEGIIAAGFVLAANTLLRPIANRINRQPMDEQELEASYAVYVICARDSQGDARERLVAELEGATYPPRELHQRAFGPIDAEIEALLYATAVNSGELDALVARLEGQAGIKQAFWGSTADT